MSRITFMRITPEESRIYDAEGDYVGDVYRQDDILNLGGHYYVVWLDEDYRGPKRVISITASVKWLSDSSTHIRSTGDGGGVQIGRRWASPSGRALRCNLRCAPISAAIPLASGRCAPCALRLPKKRRVDGVPNNYSSRRMPIVPHVLSAPTR